MADWEDDEGSVSGGRWTSKADWWRRERVRRQEAAAPIEYGGVRDRARSRGQKAESPGRRAEAVEYWREWRLWWEWCWKHGVDPYTGEVGP